MAFDVVRSGDLWLEMVQPPNPYITSVYGAIKQLLIKFHKNLSIDDYGLWHKSTLTIKNLYSSTHLSVDMSC